MNLLLTQNHGLKGKCYSYLNYSNAPNLIILKLSTSYFMTII
jgi:hypothetical protein